MIIAKVASSLIGRFKSTNSPLTFPAKAFFAKLLEMLAAISLIVLPDSNSFFAPSGNVIVIAINNSSLNNKKSPSAVIALGRN